MKKTLIILFLALSIVSQGQTFSSLLKDRTKVFNVKDYRAVGDSTTLDQDAIQNAINAAELIGGVVYFPKGVYRVNSLEVNGDVSLVGDNAKLVGTASTESNYIVEMTGTLISNTTLSGNEDLGQSEISVTATTAFAAGDYVMVADTSYAYTTDGRNMEFNRIASVGEGVLNLTRRLIGSYTTANTARVYLYSPVKNVFIEGLTFENLTGTYGGGLRLQYCHNVKVINCHFRNAYDPSCYSLRSTEIEFVNCTAKDGQNTTESHGYGFVFGESHHCSMSGNYTENIRENFITNRSRYINAYDNIFKTSYDSGINVHGAGSSYIEILNNTIEGGCGGSYGIYAGASNAADVDILIKGNTIINVLADGIGINGNSDGIISRIIIDGNKIKNYGLTTAGEDHGIYTDYVHDLEITNNIIQGVGTGADYGIRLIEDSIVFVSGNVISDIPNGRGIGFAGSGSVVMANNFISTCSSYNFRNLLTNTTVILHNNWTDDTSNSLDGTEVLFNNYFGVNYSAISFLRINPQADPPSSAVEGMIYMDTDHHLYVHNGSTWVQLDN